MSASNLGESGKTPGRGVSCAPKPQPKCAGRNRLALPRPAQKRGDAAHPKGFARCCAGRVVANLLNWHSKKLPQSLLHLRYRHGLGQ